MIRIYLDWNVFSYLKQFKETKEPYSSLHGLLTNHEEHILIPYTSAHLSDLITSYKKSEKGKQQTLLDLAYLKNITQEHCLLHDHTSGDTYPVKYLIQEYFQQLLENDDLYNNGIDGLFDGLGFGLNFLKAMPGMPAIAPITQSNSEVLKSIISSFACEGSVYDTLNSFFNLLSQYHTDPTFYRSLRNASLEEMNLSNDYTTTDNLIEELDKVLQSSAFQKDFKAFADQMMGISFKNKTPSRLDTFTTYYTLLDFLGYYRDKVFKNMLQDSFHAYYGAYCDFFVTDDINTYHKAKAIYNYFNIGTVVCRTHEFVHEFYKKSILDNDHEARITEILPQIINTGFVITTSIDNELNPVVIYETGPFVLSYFNRMQTTTYTGKGISVHLFKNSKNYSSFYFYKELEVLTNKIVKQFGADINLRYEFIRNVDGKELKERIWPGRVWQFDSTKIELAMKEHPFGITLSFYM